MGLFVMHRAFDYWNFDSKRANHAMIISYMNHKRWEQIKRYLKIYNPINDEKVDTQGSD